MCEVTPTQCHISLSEMEKRGGGYGIWRNVEILAQTGG